ncbi:MAG: hypothetical protein AB7G75_29720 [Candidatus Binatia bacterium]
MLYWLVFFFCTLLGITVPISFTSAQIPATAGWYEIPNTTLQTVCPPNRFNGSNYFFQEYCVYVTLSWSGGALDSKRNRMIVWGGGPSYAGNELYAVDVNTQVVSRLTDPSLPFAPASPCQETNGTGTTPNTRATYDGLVYLPNEDQLLAWGGALTCYGAQLSMATWTYDFATGVWQNRNPGGTLPRGTVGQLSAYDPQSGRAYVHDLSHLYFYDFAANAYTRVTTANAYLGYHLNATMDTKRRRFYLIGYDSLARAGRVYYYDLNETPPVLRQQVTSGGEAVINTIRPGVTYDTVADRILAWSGGNTVYALDPVSGVWTPHTYAGGPGAASPNGTFGRWEYVPSLGVVVLVNAMTQNVFTFRLAETPPPPPPPPPGGQVGWQRLPNTQLQTVCPPNNFGNLVPPAWFFSRCYTVIAAWGGGMLDTKRNRMIVWGGGHRNYPGNELYAVNLNDASIERVTDPSLPLASGVPPCETNGDGTTPNSRHPFDGVAYLAQYDRLFVWGGALYCEPLTDFSTYIQSKATWTFDFATKKWQQMFPSGENPSYGGIGQTTAYDPATGRVYLHDLLNLYSYDFPTNHFTKVTPTRLSVPLGWHFNATMDTKRRRFYLFGYHIAYRKGAIYYYDLNEAAPTLHVVVDPRDPTTPSNTWFSNVYPGVTYDPVRDRIFGWVGGDTVHVFNPENGTWTSTSFPGLDAPGTAQVNGTMGRWEYVPALQAIALVNDMEEDAYLFRYGP